MRYSPAVSMPTPRSRRAALAGLFGLSLLLIAAYAVPRIYLWHGVTSAVHHQFLDVHGHLFNLDTICRQATLPAAARQARYLTDGPGKQAGRLKNPVRWPHGVYQVASIWGCRLGILSPWTTRLTNLLFTVVLLFGVFGLTRELAGEVGRRRPVETAHLGLWACVLVLLTPPLLGSSLFFHLDYPLVGMVAVGLYLLALTRGFTRRLATVNFAIWSVLGLWIKLTYALYLAAPVAALLVALLVKRRWARAGETLAVALAAGALAVLLQGIDLATLALEVQSHAARPLHSGHDNLEQGTLRWAVLPLILTWYAYPWPLLLPALPGLGLAHLRGRISSRRLLLLTAIWGPVLLLCLLSNRMERYMHPVYPLLGILTVLGVAALLPRRLRHVCLGTVTVLFAFMLVFTHLERTFPWFGSEEQMVSDAFYHEAPVPDRFHLLMLRANGAHPRCDTRGLQAAISKVMLKAPPHLPLVVGVDGGSRPDLFMGNQRYLDNYTILYTLNQVRGRFIMEGDLTMSERQQARTVRLSPLVLSLHNMDEPTDDRLPRHHPLAREEVSIQCLERTIRAELTLYGRLADNK